MSHKISASILAADFARLGEEAEQVLAAGADRIHFDVMDNHYVPNLTIGSMVCQALRDYGISAPIDVHLMVAPVDRIIGDFIDAGASSISIHPEATRHPHRSLALIREAKLDAGIALNPGTALTLAQPLLDLADHLLLMSVNPGFGGQKFIPSTLTRLREIKAMIETQAEPPVVSVDGGVNVNNIGQLGQLGVNIFVAGSAIFGAENYGHAISEMRAALDGAAHD